MIHNQKVVVPAYIGSGIYGKGALKGQDASL